jgi:hypothetical protein
VGVRESAAVLACAALVLATGCGAAAESSPPYALEARLGVYTDGSGRAGLSALATLRDPSGAGPDIPCNVAVHDASGATVATLDYAASGNGSYAATWLPGVAPSAGTYELVAAGAGGVSEASVSLSDVSGLPLPVPVLASGASRIDWDPVPGAQGYLCRIYSGGLLELETSGTAPGCDLSALPPGAYSASIVALSADLGAIAESPSPRPALGGPFHVSEARLGFARSEGTAPAVLLRAAGGAYDDGIGDRSLALWVSITDPAGVPTNVTWEVEVVGPNLPADAPLVLTYWASFPRLMAWSPDVPAAPGVYTVTARSTLGAATVQMTVGAPAWFDQPLGVTATNGAQGSAHAAWEPVAGAKAYLAKAYDGATGALVASQWVAATSAEFPADTFVAGRSYDVFVAATDADMLYGAVPTQVSVADNVFDYASFTAR